MVARRKEQFGLTFDPRPVRCGIPLPVEQNLPPPLSITQAARSVNGLKTIGADTPNGVPEGDIFPPVSSLYQQTSLPIDYTALALDEAKITADNLAYVAGLGSAESSFGKRMQQTVPRADILPATGGIFDENGQMRNTMPPGEKIPRLQSAPVTRGRRAGLIALSVLPFIATPIAYATYEELHTGANSAYHLNLKDFKLDFLTESDNGSIPLDTNAFNRAGPETQNGVTGESILNPENTLPGSPFSDGARILIDTIELIGASEKAPGATFRYNREVADPENPQLKTYTPVLEMKNGRVTLGTDLATIYLQEADTKKGPFTLLATSFTDPVTLLYQEIAPDGTITEKPFVIAPRLEEITPTSDPAESVRLYLLSGKKDKKVLLQSLAASEDALRYVLDVLPPNSDTGNLYLARDDDFTSGADYEFTSDGVVIRTSILVNAQTESQKKQYLTEAMLASTLYRTEINETILTDIINNGSYSRKNEAAKALLDLRKSVDILTLNINSGENEEKRRVLNEIDNALGITDRKLLANDRYTNEYVLAARLLTLLSQNYVEAVSMANPRVTPFSSLTQINNFTSLTRDSFNLLQKRIASNGEISQQELLDRLFNYSLGPLRMYDLISYQSYSPLSDYFNDPVLRAARIAAYQAVEKAVTPRYDNASSAEVQAPLPKPPSLLHSMDEGIRQHIEGN